MTIDNDNDYDKGWLSSDDSPGCAFGSSDEFAGNKGIREYGNAVGSWTVGSRQCESILHCKSV
ncbi:MAG: hypothetical protein FVQ77_10540 [Cytophagales bacterium]|nr:hypothetical protein [Cytophagales bacterium]